MSIQFNVCPLNHVSILREMFTDRMKSNIWWRCCVTATHWIAPPGTNAFAWYVFCLGAVHNTLISTSSISTDLATQEFFGFLPICLASCSCMSLRSLLSLSLRHSSLTMFSAELKEKSGSTIVRTHRRSALITCYSTLTKVFLNWSSADPWFSSLCCPPTFCPPLLFSTLTISETTRIEMSL